ncbi:hypothetical protein Pmani_030642 [Petrolisthes manimaculis]|uniref:Uncharacterized protein n=1 Tax=Petrolisthes manimaculis TaxID=1843537 RepID=A0AAE1NWX4_9EUCA|nr:hypothetical protein Pmani_030642 [Petrolisthes manimaculis]
MGIREKRKCFGGKEEGEGRGGKEEKWDCKGKREKGKDLGGKEADRRRKMCKKREGRKEEKWDYTRERRKGRNEDEKGTTTTTNTDE